MIITFPIFLFSCKRYFGACRQGFYTNETRISAKCCECKMEFAIELHELNIVKENKYCRNYDEQNLNARPQ